MSKKTIAGAVAILVAMGTVGVVAWKIGKSGVAPVAVMQPVANKPIQPTPEHPAASSAQPAPAVTDETANWKTFTDREAGLSVKYPPNYEIRQEGGGLDIMDPKSKSNESRGIVFTYYGFVKGCIGGTGCTDENGKSYKTIDSYVSSDNKIRTIRLALSKTTVAGAVTYVGEGKSNDGKRIDRQYTLYVKNGNTYDLYSFLVVKGTIGEKIFATLNFAQ